MKTIFEQGDIVCFRRSFLQSIGYYTDVPLNGKVLDVMGTGGGLLVLVEWCDDHISRVNTKDLILYSERGLEPG